MIRAARRWVREDAAFVAVAPCLVVATYTPLGGALAARRVDVGGRAVVRGANGAEARAG